MHLDLLSIPHDGAENVKTFRWDQRNAPRSSEHPPVRGKNVKTFRWDHRLQIHPMVLIVTFGQQYYVGEKPTVILTAHLQGHQTRSKTKTETMYNGGLLPDIILLTQCYLHRGTCLNAMKRFCICSL